MEKMLIFGYTKSGREIAKELQSLGYQVEVFDTDNTTAKLAQEDGYDVYYREIIDDDFLLELGVGTCVNALFCMSHDDSHNLFVTLSSRYLCSKIKIITVIESQNDERKMLLAGANRTISPHTIGALKAFRLIKKPKLLGTLEEILLSSGNLKVKEIPVLEGSLLDKVYVKDLQIQKKYNIIVLGILDKELSERFTFFASGINHKIDVGDTLVVIGYEEQIQYFSNEIQKGKQI